MATYECSFCATPNEVELSAETFAVAIRALKRRRYVDMLDKLEIVLPSEFVGFADDILKWAGKTR